MSRWRTGSSLFTQSHAAHVHAIFYLIMHDELTATFDPTMRFKRSNSNLENFHDVFGVAAFSLLLTPWKDKTLARSLTALLQGTYKTRNGK